MIFIIKTCISHLGSRLLDTWFTFNQERLILDLVQTDSFIYGYSFSMWPSSWIPAVVASVILNAPKCVFRIAQVHCSEIWRLLVHQIGNFSHWRSYLESVCQLSQSWSLCEVDKSSCLLCGILSSSYRNSCWVNLQERSLFIGRNWKHWL